MALPSPPPETVGENTLPPPPPHSPVTDAVASSLSLLVELNAPSADGDQGCLSSILAPLKVEQNGHSDFTYARIYRC